MKQVKLNIPNATVLGHLYERYDDPALLDQDILEVQLHNGITIDVGWFPEYDPNGRFKVTVYKDYTNNVRGGPYYYKSSSDVAKAVSRLAMHYASSQAIFNEVIWGSGVVYSNEPISQYYGSFVVTGDTRSNKVKPVTVKVG